MGHLIKDDLGKIGESIAAKYLAKNGYEILDMNFSNELGYRRGEIDIVARDNANNEIVFVEVKSREKNLFSQNPEQAITKQKYHKLSRIISSYLNKKRMVDCNYRLDAIAIELDINKKKANLKHLKHIYF